MPSISFAFKNNNIFAHFKHSSSFSWLFASLFFCSQAIAGTPTFTMTFSPTTIAPGSLSTLTFSIDNSSNDIGVSQVGFTNTLPTGMTILNPSNAITDCTSGVFSAVVGTNTLSFSDYRLGLNESCTFSVDVTSATAGVHLNTSSALTSSAGSSGTANATLTVDSARPGFSALFSPATITPSSTSTLQYTIDNTINGSTANFLIFSSSLPSGLLIASQPNATTNCSGGVGTPAVTAVPLSNSLSLSLGSVLAGATCTVEVDVTASNAGIYNHTSGVLSQNGSNPSGSASAQLVVDVPFLNAVFPNSATPGSSVNLTYTITNADRSNDATNISFTNDLNATLSGLAATALPSAGFCGAGSSISGSSNLSLSGLSVASGDSCTFSVTVLIPSNAAAGSFINTTSTITLNLGSATTKPATSNNLVIDKAPVLTMTFIDDPVGATDDVTLRFNVANTDDVNTASAIGFTLPYGDIFAGMIAKTIPASNSCGAGSTFQNTTTSGSGYTFKLLNGSIVAGGSCDFDVVFTLPSIAQPNQYSFVSSAVAATINTKTLNGPAASDVLSVVGAPTLTFSITEDYINADGVLTAQFTLNYGANALVDVTGVGFNIDLNAGLAGLTSTTATQNDVCGSGSSFGGSSTLTLTGASLSAGESCTITLALKVPANAVAGNVTLSTSSVSGTTSGQAVVSDAASETFVVSGLTFLKSFIPNNPVPGSNVVIRYEISNSATSLAASSIVFTDSLTQALSSFTSTSTPLTPCGSSSAITGTTTLIFSGGELAPGANCTFDVTALVPAGATTGSYSSVTSNLSATVDSANTTNQAASATLNVENLTTVLATTAASTTLTSPIPVSISFSRDIANFTLTDLIVGNGSASNLGGSGKDFTVDIIPSTDGVVTIDLPAGVVDDFVVSAHKNQAAAQLSLTYSSVPSTPIPTISISEPSVTSTNTGPVFYTVTYENASEINLSTSAISLNNTSGTNASIAVTGTGTDTRTITLNNITGNGTLGISLEANTARNGTQTALAFGPSTTFVVDNEAPTVIVSSSALSPYNSPFVVTFTFSEPVTGFDSADISVSNGSASEFSIISGSVYSAKIMPTGNGSVTVNIASGQAIDSVGNANLVSNTFSAEYDTQLPSVSIDGPSSAVNTAFTGTFTFSEPVSGFDISDITVTNAIISNFSVSSDSLYSALFTPEADGEVTVKVNGNLAIDNANNNNSESNLFEVTYDATSPTVDITGPSELDSSNFVATITFSEVVTGLELSDIVASNAVISNLSGVGTTYTLDVAISEYEIISLYIPAGVVTDGVGNTNIASSPYTNSVDTSKPTVALIGPKKTQNDKFKVDVSFNKKVIGFDSSDISITNGELIEFSGKDYLYSVMIKPFQDKEGDITLNIPEGVAIDAFGFLNRESSELNIPFDTLSPTVLLASSKESASVNFSVEIEFSEDVSDFGIEDLHVAGAQLNDFTLLSKQQYKLSLTGKALIAEVKILPSFVFDNAGNSVLEAKSVSINFDLDNDGIFDGDDLDIDGDGVSNVDELESGTDPYNKLDYVSNKPMPWLNLLLKLND